MSSATEDVNSSPLTCIASTAIGRGPSVERIAGDRKPGRGEHITKAQFTPDGTTIIAQHDDHHLKTFVLPTNLLEEEHQPHRLTAYATHKSATEIQDFAIFPGFDLSDVSTTYALCGDNDQPISLRNVCDWTHSEAKYPLVNDRNEAHYSPRTLHFVNSGSHFLVGTHNNLAVFDITRYNAGPVSLLQLKPRKGTYNGMPLTRKAYVSALATSVDGLLALGTTEREIALHDHSGMGERTAAFNTDPYRGTGVSVLKWSPCGKYLLVAERRSDEIHVFDIRDTRSHVSTLIGRAGNTNQRLGLDILHTRGDGYELWAGGMDGVVRIWHNPGSKEGECPPSEELEVHEAPVTSTIWHPFTSILATSAGSRSNTYEDEQNPPGEIDNSLRVHTVGSSNEALVSYFLSSRMDSCLPLRPPHEMGPALAFRPPPLRRVGLASRPPPNVGAGLIFRPR
ncbi:hypothetical protein TI39_contig4145g00027 [Zymoseptoria brevis]|uniref:WD repeat-containing protein n=1 Tax=Zymoseptoria brevis TaxID=1047168 RepID=A0A0F4GC67_9PEZI|nr:hypothetical protein TI39_contig4145g00027 [Zymoseptoria brevis]